MFTMVQVVMSILFRVPLTRLITQTLEPTQVGKAGPVPVA